MNPQFKDNNFITIQGWMVSKLKLKANELLIYAIIYGFSQDDTSKFYGSITYLETAIGASRNTVINTLKKLTDNGLLVRTEFTENGVPRVMYKCNLERLSSAEIEPVQSLRSGSANFDNGSANSDGGSAEIDRGSAETAPNNILEDSNNILEDNNNNIKEEFFDFRGLKFPIPHQEHIKKFKENSISLETFMIQNNIKNESELNEIFFEFLKHLNIEDKTYPKKDFREFRRHFVNWSRVSVKNREKSVKINKNLYI